MAVSIAMFGRGSGPIKMDEVMCIGRETALINCEFDRNNDCSHFEDAGVVCSSGWLIILGRVYRLSDLNFVST